MPKRMGTVGEEIGKNVRRLRKQRGWTQETLAQKVGVKRHTVMQLEKGDKAHTHATIAAVALALGTSIDALQGPPTATQGVVSPDALRLAAMFDQLPEEDQRTVRYLIERLYAGRPSRPG